MVLLSLSSKHTRCAVDDEGLEMGNERDDERERWDAHIRQLAELRQRRVQLEQDSGAFNQMMLEHV